MGKGNKEEAGHEVVKKISVKARNAIDSLWQKALTKARSWGTKRDGDNPFFRTNIMYSCQEGKNIVIITFTEDGEAVIHEYGRVIGTDLGRETKTLLREKGIPVKE